MSLCPENNQPCDWECASGWCVRLGKAIAPSSEMRDTKTIDQCIRIWESHGKVMLTLKVPGRGFWTWEDEEGREGMAWAFKEHFGIQGLEKASEGKP